MLAQGKNTMKTFWSATANGFEPACRAKVSARLRAGGRWTAVRNALGRAGRGAAVVFSGDAADERIPAVPQDGSIRER